MTVKIWRTQFTQSKNNGEADLWELRDFLKKADENMVKNGNGYSRIEELEEMVRQMIVNSENILGGK